MKKILLPLLMFSVTALCSQNKEKEPVELSPKVSQDLVRRLVTIAVGTQDAQLEIILSQALDPKAKKPEVYPELIEVRAQIAVLVRTLHEKNTR